MHGEPLPTEPYLEQVARWPAEGRHILAHYDESTVVVYQAYKGSIGAHAVAHGAFGGPEFSFSRMSWIKPNFLWMMYRSAWATSEGQETVLAVRLSRAFFDRILSEAVWSAYDAERYGSQTAWQAQLAGSDVRLQWDPDHDPAGSKLERRAIQLGLRGAILRAYATTEVREIVDMTPFANEQRAYAQRDQRHLLRTPIERVYVPEDAKTAANVGL